MAIHAAAHHGARAVGVTISQAQAELARERVAEAGLADRVEIRLQDYRDLGGETFDAISSIGMFEHVGPGPHRGVLRRPCAACSAPRGRLLNHAISSVGGSRLGRRSFMGRYVFPDGELLDVGDVVLAMERAGFEVRDVESLREHYAAHPAGLGRQPGGPLGRGGRPGRRGPGPGLAAVHGGSAVGLRGRRHRHPPGPRDYPGPDGGSGMPPTRRGWE